jgi:hypothetical protein
MTKFKTKRKQKGFQEGIPAKKFKTAAIVTPPPDARESKTIQSIGVDDDDLDLAINTLKTLAENPSVIKSKSCKDLRTAIYDFRQACTTGVNAAGDTNLTARISGALADEQYIEARIMLAEMRIRGKTPKLGALCRWVRDLDVVSGLAEQLDPTGRSRSPREKELLVVLDAILRLTSPTDYTIIKEIGDGPIIPRKHWDIRETSTRRPVYDCVLDGSIFTSLPKDVKSKFRIIETTPGLQRKPANLYPAILHASEDNAINLSADVDTIQHNHPTVPNLYMLEKVLSPEECVQIVAVAETIGFTPDAPIRAEGEESSVLAHNFYWIVDNAFCTKLWERVRGFMPTNAGGRKARGINRRFRVYRYVPGAEYRAHIGKLDVSSTLVSNPNSIVLRRWCMASVLDQSRR